jgi:hypothetical protein
MQIYIIRYKAKWGPLLINIKQFPAIKFHPPHPPLSFKKTKQKKMANQLYTVTIF